MRTWNTELGTLTGEIVGPEDAPIVLFLSGLRHPRTMWSRQVEACRHKYRCAVIDWPGQGTSTEPAPGCAIESMSHAVQEIAALEGWTRVHLVGFSMGGMVALRLAADAGALVKSLILIGTSGNAEPTLMREFAYKPMLFMIRRWGWNLTPGLCVHLFYSLRYIWWTMPGNYAALKRMIVECGPLQDASLANAVVFREGLDDNALRGIEAATLVMRGRWDLVRRRGESVRLVKLIPNAEKDVYTSPSSGHGVCAEDSEFINSHLLRFLKRVTDRELSIPREAARS